MEIKIVIPEPLAEMFKQACEQTRCTPQRFASEVLESDLAARRLPYCEAPGQPHGTLSARDDDEE